MAEGCENRDERRAAVITGSGIIAATRGSHIGKGRLVLVGAACRRDYRPWHHRRDTRLPHLGKGGLFLWERRAAAMLRYICAALLEIPY